MTWAALGIAIYYGLPDWPSRGQFGDVFGAVNALFSGLAFAGVVYAIVLQRRELALQREEMELSRKEPAAQNTLISAQLSTMQESWAFERSKTLREAQPVFVAHGGSASYGEKTCKFYNAGAAVTDLSAAVHGLVASLSHTKVLGRGAEATLSVKAPIQAHVPDFRVTLHYTDALGTRHSKSFLIPEKSHDWIEQPENSSQITQKG